MSGQIAFFLRHTLGLSRGERIGILSPNSTLYQPLVLGIVRAGLACVTLNPIYSAEELVHPFEDSDIRTFFVHPATLERVHQAQELAHRSMKLTNGQNAVWLMDDSDSISIAPSGEHDFRTMLNTHELPVVDTRRGDDTAMIVYSSGTSGKPKGVVLSHDNMVTGTHIFELLSFGEWGPKSVVIGVLPFFHIFGLNFFALSSFLCATPVVVIPRFDLTVFCGAVQRFKCTQALVVPPMLLALSRHPAVDKFDMSSLKAALSGAAPLGPELIEEVQARLPHLRISQGYGLSETSPVLLRASPEDHDMYKGTVGRVAPYVELRLVNHDGIDVGFAQDGDKPNPGEIWARGRPIMKGYQNNQEETDSCITPDGWFKTGDVAIIKNGCFFIVDRIKELIKYKGFQVSPAELEDTLLGNYLVADCAVVGVQNKEQATELPRAYIVPTSSGLDLKTATQSEKEAFCKEMQEWLNKQVANHKQLRGGVFLIDQVPKSASGKILRRSLRDIANSK